MERFLGVRGLELSPEKTVIMHIADGFDFLGQNVRKYDGTQVIKPSRKSVKALLEYLFNNLGSGGGRERSSGLAGALTDQVGECREVASA